MSAEALALYRLACESHKRADWRRASHALAAALEAVATAPAPIAPPDPPAPVHAPPGGLHAAAKPQPVAKLARGQSLVQFLAVRGIKDTGGELAAMDGELWHRARPFQRRLVRDDGLGIEEAAERAFDAGYFPDVVAPDWSGSDNSQAVSEADLLEAIRQELAGRPIYAGEDDRWHALEPFEREAMHYGD